MIFCISRCYHILPTIKIIPDADYISIYIFWFLKFFLSLRLTFSIICKIITNISCWTHLFNLTSIYWGPCMCWHYARSWRARQMWTLPSQGLQSGLRGKINHKQNKKNTMRWSRGFQTFWSQNPFPLLKKRSQKTFVHTGYINWYVLYKTSWEKKFLFKKQQK